MDDTRTPGILIALVAAAMLAAAPSRAADTGIARKQTAAVPIPKHSPIEAKTEAAPSIRDTAIAAARAAVSPWGYDGSRGPEHWSGIDPSYKICGNGKRQSPIDIVGAGAARLAPLRFHYKLSAVDLEGDGTSLGASYGPGSYLTVGDRRYDLKSFAIHSPSEHTVAGRRFPVEIEFEHRDAAGQPLVVSVLATVGGENLAAGQILDRLPDAPGGKIANPRLLMNARDLMPDTRHYFRYDGSLTVPPCTEGVARIVLAAPIKLSEKQIARLRQSLDANARPIQRRDGRYLVQSLATR